MELQIRRFRPTDLPALKALTVEAFDGVSIDQNIERQFGLIHGRDWRHRKGRAMETDAARDSDGIFVAEFGGELAGFVTTWMDRDAGLGWISHLAVSANCRRQGVANRLIDHAFAHFRNHGLSHARIETLEQNAVGQTMFASRGFSEVARQIHYCIRLDG